MNTTNFTGLAEWLIDTSDCGLGADIIQHGNDDIFGTGEDDGPLFAAHDELIGGNLLGALERLGTVVTLAEKPVDPPTSGRNRLERHLAATRQREGVGRLAQIARVLVLDGLKATPPSVIAADRTRATSASHHPIQGA